jgi:hypothetical protein
MRFFMPYFIAFFDTRTIKKSLQAALAFNCFSSKIFLWCMLLLFKNIFVVYVNEDGG